MEPSEIKKRRKRVIRRDPTKSPFYSIKSKINKQEPEIDEQEIRTDFQRKMDQLFEQASFMMDEEKPKNKHYQLLKMIYSEDIDSDYAISQMRISENELKLLVDELVKFGYLQFSSEDEAEITEEGILYIINRENQMETYEF